MFFLKVRNRKDRELIAVTFAFYDVIAYVTYDDHWNDKNATLGNVWPPLDMKSAKALDGNGWERSRKGHIKMNIQCYTLFTNSEYPGPSAFIPTFPTPENLALVSSSSQSSSHGGLESPR